MLIKYKNGRLMLIILVIVLCVFGVGFIVLDKFTSNQSNKNDNINDIVPSTKVTDIGLTNGFIDVNTDIIQSLFNYFREDRNCLSNYNDIEDNKTKLIIAYNNLYENQTGSINCKDVYKLIINDKYFCSKSLDEIDYDVYKIGINSSSFLNLIKKKNTSIVNTEDMDKMIHNIFGTTSGYINESFLFGSDSYIYFDNNTSKYIMYKYFDNKECKTYKQELVSAYSNNGILEIRMQLKDNNSIIKNTLLTFKFNNDTGEYVIISKGTY